MTTATQKKNTRVSKATASKRQAASNKVAVEKPNQSLDSTDKQIAAAKRTEAAMTDTPAGKSNNTAIANCVQEELIRYFDMLDGEDPANLYHLVMRQAEHALIELVMQKSGGNQSKATKWLGISRGNLRNKLADMEYD